MRLAVPVLLGLILLWIAVTWLRLQSKRRRRDAFLLRVAEQVRGNPGVEPLGDGVFRIGEKYVKVEAGTNPLFSRHFSLRLAAWSDTVHEFELRRGRPAPPEFADYVPLLERWGSAGKLHFECWAAGVSSDPDVLGDLRALAGLAARPLSKPCRGKTFTVREGFESKVPQWHWRHDQRPRLPPGAKRWCFSYWHGDAYLNEGILRVFEILAEGRRAYYVCDAEDLSFLEFACGRRGLDVHGTLVEVPHATAAIGADRTLDGEFFRGMFVSDALPKGYDDVPRHRFHDRAIPLIPDLRFYARRLFDEECSWFSGEYEIVSVHPLDVRGAVEKAASEFGAQVLEIDRRFHKRIVVPFEY